MYLAVADKLIYKQRNRLKRPCSAYQRSILAHNHTEQSLRIAPVAGVAPDSAGCQVKWQECKATTQRWGCSW